MDPCTVETGLLRKKPCGHTSVTQCLNCERPLCAQHAVAQPTDSGRKSGKFLCQECKAAWRDIEKHSPSAPAPAPANKPAAPDKPAAPKAAPAAAKEAPAAPKPDDKADGGIDFTPSKK